MKLKTIIKTLVAIIIIGGGLAYFMYQAMRSSWSYYYSVDDFSANSLIAKSNSLRLAGKVKPGTINRDLQNMDLNFQITGAQNEIPVQYHGTIPDNFADNKEVVIEGRLNSAGIFQADLIITKCESKYKAKVN